MARSLPRRLMTAISLVALLVATFVPDSWVQGEVVVVEEVRLVRARLVRPEASSKRSWGPEQVEGAPDTPGSGDSPTAWASLSQDGQEEWLVCEYAQPVEPRAVVVHASYNPGALIRVSAFNAAGDEVVAWEGEDPTPKSSPRGVSVIPVKLKFPVQRIKVTLDSQGVSGWNEIDAIGLEDKAGKPHWATKVETSTTYAVRESPAPVSTKPSYAPSQATGAPDCPQPGDQGVAWAPATPDGQAEWMVCQYETAQQPFEIVVHENTAPGAIHKISAFNGKDEEVVVWEGVDPTPRDQPWGVSVFPINTEFAFKKLKLYINSPAVSGYNEIDAVGLRALNGDTQWAKEAQASSSYGMAQAAMPAAVQPAVEEEPKEEKSMKMSADQQSEIKQLRKELDELKAQLKELKKK